MTVHDSDAGTDTLTGVRVWAPLDDAAVAALRGAGAEVIVAGSEAPVHDGRVVVVPAVAALGGSVHVVADDLSAANRALSVMAAAADTPWPADTRFALPGVTRIGVRGAVPEDLRTALSNSFGHPVADAGLELDGLDAIVVDRRPPVPYHLGAVSVPVGGSDLTILVRAFDDAVALDIAATLTGETPIRDVWPLAAADPVELVVFGAHLRGGPLVHQLTDVGARWAGEITTAARYRMTVLPTAPPKPAITRVADGDAGSALYGHRWLMSAAALGRFLAALPAPMQLGKVEFGDGTWRTAFGCDASAATGPDISGYGSWPAAIVAGAVDGAGRP